MGRRNTCGCFLYIENLIDGVKNLIRKITKEGERKRHGEEAKLAPKNQQIKVRMQLPISIHCNTCGNYIYKGTRFNSRKEDVLGEANPGIQIYRFYFKCCKCFAELAIKTDPENSDYVVESGATRNFEETPPANNMLFIRNLPHETKSIMLQVLFQQYPGFREVRMVEAKSGTALVEFEDEVKSSIAMQALQGFKITPQNPVAITFAKK